MNAHCPHCNVALTPGAKFCSECGAKLGPGTSRRPVAPGGERRQVTILFADITGYTRLSSEIDPEELHALLNRYFERVNALVRDFGGTVDKHIGDAVMGVFGAPVSHGNDAERAVRAALAIHDAMPALSHEIGRPLSVHIGVANGEVVAATSGSEVHREYTVLGDAVNLASRLDGLAGAGETVVSAGVQRAVARLVDAESVGEVSVKGLSEPVRVYKVRGLGPARPRFQAPLVGRDGELVAFSRLAACAVDESRGAVLSLCGEPGVGKTRLVAEMCERGTARGFEIHQGLVLDFGTSRGTDAVRAVVKSALGLSLDASSAERDACALEAERAGSYTDDELACLNDLLDRPQTAALRGRYDALSDAMRATTRARVVASVVERASLRAPALVVVEDVHWADPSTLVELAMVAASARAARILLLVTARSEGDPLDTAWLARTEGVAFERIDLLPLDASAAQKLAEHLGAPDSRRLRACVERSGGNPLFLEQLLTSDTEGVLPDSVQSLVQARMDRLAPADKRALQAAAVIGQRFSLELVRHLLGEPEYGPAGLVERDLVRPAGDAWLFAHALVRDGVYSSLLKQARRELHRRAATWFGSSDPGLRAEHLDRAEDPAAPSAYAAAAGERVEALDYDRALVLLRRGAELATRPEDVHALAQREGELMLYRAEPDAAKAAFERALTHATSDLSRCRAFIGLADAHRIVQATPEGHAALDQALALVAQSGMDSELSRIHRIRGSLLFTLGKDGHEEQELALEHAVSAGDLELEARALSCLGDAFYLLGRSRVAHDYFQRCIDLCRRQGLGRVELYQHYMLGITRMFMGDLRGGLLAVLHGLELASRAGHRRAEMIARESKCLIQIQMGAFEDALAESELALELARATGSRMFEGMLLTERAEALLMLGQEEAARRDLSSCKALEPAADWWLVGPLSYSLEVFFVADEAEAERTLSLAQQGLSASPRGLMALFFHARAADACLARGYVNLAESQAKLALSSAEDAPLVNLLARRTLALVEHRRGSRDPELIARLAGYRSEAERIGLVPTVALIDRALAS